MAERRGRLEAGEAPLRHDRIDGRGAGDAAGGVHPIGRAHRQERLAALVERELDIHLRQQA